MEFNITSRLLALVLDVNLSVLDIKYHCIINYTNSQQG
jgi:hypothetical protein